MRIFGRFGFGESTPLSSAETVSKEERLKLMPKLARNIARFREISEIAESALEGQAGEREPKYVAYVDAREYVKKIASPITEHSGGEIDAPISLEDAPSAEVLAVTDYVDVLAAGVIEKHQESDFKHQHLGNYGRWERESFNDLISTVFEEKMDRTPTVEDLRAISQYLELVLKFYEQNTAAG